MNHCYDAILCKLCVLTMYKLVTSVLHGSSGVTSTGPSLKGGRPSCFVGLGRLILRLSTGHRQTQKIYLSLAR